MWAELALQANETGERIYELAERGALGWSSGTSPHLAEREKVGGAIWIKTWPVIEVSVCPAAQTVEPRAKIGALKSFYDSVVTSDAEQRAAEIYAKTLITQHQLRMREFERSQHDDSRSEEQAFYSALAETELRKLERMMRS